MIRQRGSDSFKDTAVSAKKGASVNEFFGDAESR